MNQVPLPNRSFVSPSNKGMVTPMASNSDSGWANPPAPRMQLRGGGSEKRPPGRNPKREVPPARQRKALHEIQNDVHGNEIKDCINRFECTMNPFKDNRFEPLRVQSLGWCDQPNATWYRTRVNNGAPRSLRCVSWIRKGIPLERRYDRAQYTRCDYFSLVCRLLPAGLATSVVVSQPGPQAGGDLVLSMLNAKTPVAPHLLFLSVKFGI